MKSCELGARYSRRIACNRFYEIITISHISADQSNITISIGHYFCLVPR